MRALSPLSPPPPSSATPQLYAFAAYLCGVVGGFVRNPAGGAGWPAVGSAFAPWDVAVLGDAGDQRSAGAAPVRQPELDADCAVFGDLFSRVERLAGG